MFGKVLNQHLKETQGELYKLLTNKLDPSLIPFTSAKKALDEMKEVAARKGMILGLTVVTDIFQVESNFVSDTYNIILLTHIPLIKSDNVVGLYQFIPTPLQLSNTSTHIEVTPNNDILAISSDRRLYKTFNIGELSQCSKLHDLTWCGKNQVEHRSTKPNCLYALFTRDFNSIESHCPIKSAKQEEFVYQTGPQQFYTFAPNPEQLYLTCDSTDESNGYKVSTVKIVGFNLLNISTGCPGVLPAHVFLTSA